MDIKAEDMSRSSPKKHENQRSDNYDRKSLSEILSDSVKPLWLGALSKPFLIEMANGTLRVEKYRVYMIQDRLYLHEYINILQIIESRAESMDGAGRIGVCGCIDADRSADANADINADICSFLLDAINATRAELELVHLPNMKKLGISEDEALNCSLLPGIGEYISYMKGLAEKGDIIDSLTALLNCSWIYAYIAEQMASRYAAKLRLSPYREWFEAYNAPEYKTANQRWINIIDALAMNLCDDKRDYLCEIFKTCARFENDFWDSVYL